jgi:hypothetical protein
MAVTLTITDKADGTGATATIAGSDPAAANIVYVGAIDGEMVGSAWSNEGDCIGDGDVELSLPQGYYFFYCTSDTEPTPIIYAAVTDGADSIYDQILDAVQARIRALLLDGVDSDNIVVRQVATERGLTYPAVVVAKQKITPGKDWLSSYDKTYGVITAFLAADNQAVEVNRAYSKWLEQIYGAFHHRRLSGVPTVYTCEIVPDDEIDREGWDKQRFLGLLILRFTSRKLRGD